MKQNDTQKMELDFVMGNGWMSSYELGSLKTGQCLRTTRIAGTGYELQLNGTRIADAEAVPVTAANSRCLCARINRLERYPYRDVEPDRGSGLTDLLPFTVSFGSVPVTLEGLSGLGLMSLIDPGIPASSSQTCSLLVAGIPVACGIAVIIGETMGMRITEVLPAAGLAAGAGSTGVQQRHSGSVVDSGYTGEKTADYNFTRPDCFTWREIKTMESIHETFVRSLSALCGETCTGGNVTLVDQLNFTEYLDGLPADAVITRAPALSRTRARIAAENRPSKLLYRPGNTPDFPESDMEEASRRELDAPVGGSVLLSGTLAETAAQQICTALRDAWRTYGGLSPRPAGTIGPVCEIRWKNGEADPALEAEASEYEMLVLVECRFTGEATLSICYPLRTLEPVLRSLGL